MIASKLIAALKLLISIKRPTLVTGEAGVGKSRIINQVSVESNMHFIDVRASLFDAVDMRGIPFVENARTRWATPEFLPDENSNEPVLILFDELNRAPLMVQNSLLQLMLDRRLGEYRLPDSVALVAAGNPESHRGVTKMSEAFASRFIHLPLVHDVGDWSKWALANGILPELLAFIRFRPNLLHSYDPKATEKAYPNPRSWEFVNQIMKKNPAPEIQLDLYTGTVGSGAAGELVGFLEVFKNLPSLDGIIMNPTKSKVPDELSVLFAVAAGLSSKATETNLDRIIAYCERMPDEFAAFTVKDATARDPLLCNTSAFVKWSIDHADMMG